MSFSGEVKEELARQIEKSHHCRMAELAVASVEDTASRRLVIAHCNNEKRAEQVRDLLCRKASFREVVITNTAGVATVYAGDGGIVVTL